MDSEKTLSKKSFLVTFFFSFMWGAFAVDRFYLGKVGTGLAKLLTFGGFGVWVIVDLAIIMTGGMRDKRGRALDGYQQYKKLAGMTVLWFAIILGITMLAFGITLIYIITQAVGNFMSPGDSNFFQGLDIDQLNGLQDMNSLDGLY